ncbi:MAG: hypothetical protein K2Q07_04985 [Burkholderiaceae bacterium]|nr:hypothetical protein [Burkholderiaceae bacterium]
MKKLLALVALIGLSITLFVGVFSFVHRPLVVGEIQKQLDHKQGYARTISSPKIVVFAGSNGRYSHRCEVLTQVLDRPCVNASIGVGIGLDFLLEQWLPLLQQGDLVYMPLEYSQYRLSAAEMHGGLQNALMVHSQRPYLWSLGVTRMAAAYGSFDLSFLIQGAVEMALDRRGFKRRSSTDSLTPQGDERGHTAALAATYAAFLRDSRAESTTVPERSDAIDVLDTALRQLHRAGVTVVGGLPTVPESVAVAPADIDRLRRLYAGAGQQFLVLPNQSRYTLGCFFDTLYHLNEDCQRLHSTAVARGLSDLLRPAATDAR